MLFVFLSSILGWCIGIWLLGGCKVLEEKAKAFLRFGNGRKVEEKVVDWIQMSYSMLICYSIFSLHAYLYYIGNSIYHFTNKICLFLNLCFIVK